MNEIPDDDEGRESLVEIDLYNLDRELLRQPKLKMHYAAALADQKARVAQLKANLDVCKADLEMEIRKSPADYGLVKVTDKGIDSAVLLQPEYQKALKLYNRARHRADLIAAVVDALEDRKSSLEKLVSLHGQAYFATPRLENEDRESLREETKRSARQAGRKRLNE